MKKLLFCLIITIIFNSTNIIPHQITNTIFAQQKPIPPYAKWGTLAMKETKEKYPNAEIVDYLHIGRESGPQTSIEKFKLWLKGQQKEFGVFVDIEFNNKTEQVIKITFQETDR
ncbi:YqzG/YhdC family protein [Neobacillus sp. K501]